MKSSCTESSSNNSIKTEFTFNSKEEVLSRSEGLMYNKRQQMHRTYCKEIADEIIKYNYVLLFGPISIKEKLHNYLNK